MGIKHFFNWYKKNFIKQMKSLRKGEDFSTVSIGIDNLMIDLNGLFHNSTQKIYEYGSHKAKPSLLGNRKKIGGINTQLKVYEDICFNIEKLFLLVKPKKRVILCIDGPAPISKQNQQRQRRFKSALEKTEAEFTQFDSNCLSPGTKFMDQISKYIDWYLRKNISTNEMWKDIEVVFSSEKVPGEGEHKLINYMRSYGDVNDRYCIHGLDADLIMLSLGTHLPNFWILREDMYDAKNEYFILDIGKTRIELAKIMNWENDTEKEENQTIPFNARYAVNDFIFMCFMVGNDFLPHVPSMEIIEGGIDYMIDVLKRVGKNYGHLTEEIKTNVILKKSSLEVFFGTISQYDKSILEDKLMKKDKFFPDLLLEKHARFDSETKRYNLNIENYRKNYYEKSFKQENFDIKFICHEYLVGLQWVLSYYTRGVPDWKWCFKHHYAPFAHELAEHTKDFQFQEKTESIPTLPFQQLLGILPPKSAGLIPVPLSQLLLDSRSEIKKFCPDKFETDISGKRQEWEGIVLLPMIDFSIILKEYNKHIDKVCPEDLKRNIVGKSYIYTFSESDESELKSSFGNIAKCKVNIKEIVL